MFSCSKVKKYFPYSLTDAVATSPNSSQMVRKMSVRAEDEEDVFDVDVSDDEKYNSDNVFQGLWIPYPDQVAEMFEKLDKGGVPVLKWRCPGRRPPEIEKEEEDMETDLNLSVEPKQEEQKEEKKAPQPTEFDFDDSSLETSTTKLTPRKTPGSSKGKKRVARMDKVLDDMIRQRKATEASKDQRKKASPKTPRGASACGRLFSSPRTPISAEKYAPSITPVTTPRGSGAKSPHNRLLGAKYSSPFRLASTSPRTPLSPKTPTSGEKTPATSPSPIGCVKIPPTDKEAMPNAGRVMEVDTSSESPVQTCCASMTHTSVANTTKFTPLTQALMSEPMVSSHLSANSLFNKHRNSHPQVTTHTTSTAVATITNTTATTTSTSVTSTIGAPCSSLSTNSTLSVTHQHFTTAQTASGQRPTISLFTHQNSVVGQAPPQTGITRVTQTHHPNSPLANSPHTHTAQSPLSQPAHSPKIHTSQSPMTHPVQSPMSHTVQSPMTQLSQSPLSQPVNSPMSQTNPSPISQPIPSPMSQHSQSPMTQLAQSPMAQPVQSPMSQPAQSPTAQSPLAQTAQSPSALQPPIAQTGQLRGTVQQNISGTKPRLTFSGKPRISTLDKPKLSMVSKPRMSLASPLTVSTSTIQSHLSSSTPTLQAQLNQAVQHQVLQQHLSQTSQQQASQLAQQQRAQAISQQQQQQQQINQAVAQQQMVSVTESSQVQMSQQQQLAQQLQLNQQPPAQLSQQQQLAQRQQQLAQQQLSQQQQLQQLSQQQAQTSQLTPQQQQQLTLALAQQQLNQQQQTGTQSMSPQMAQQLSQLIKQQRIQMTLRQQRAAQQQQHLAQVKAQQLVSNQQLVQQQLAQLNAQQMAQTTSQPHLAQSTVQISQAPAQPNVTTASPAPKVWSKTSSQHQLLQAALSQVPQNQTSLSQMIQAFKSRMNPTTHPQLFKSISQLTQANQPQINQVNQLHGNQPQSTLASSSPSLSTLMASQSPTTLSTQTHPASAVSFSSSENIPNTSQSSGHLTQVIYHSQASLVTNPSHIGLPATNTSVAQPATTQQPSPAITQPSLLMRKEEAISAQQTQLGIQKNEPTDYKLSIFTQAPTRSAAVTTAESVIPAHFGSQVQVTRTDASHSLARQLSNFGRKPLTSESGGLSTQLTLSETPTTSQTNTLISQSSQTPTTQTRFVPSGLLQTSIESALLTRKRFVTPGDTVASNQERFTLSTMGQAINRAAHPTVSQANELSSPSGRERLTLASMLQPFDLAGLSQQEKQTLSTLTQSRDLSFLQNSASENEATTSTSQQFATINKPVSTTGFPHMQIGEPQVSQSYIIPSYGPSAMIGKPPPPYSVAIAEKALSSMRTSMAGRKDANIVTQITSATVASVTSATEKNVTFVKKPETSLPSTTLVWVTTPNTSDVGAHIASSHSSFVTSQLGINTQPTFAAGGSHVSVQKISVQQPQQPAMTSEMMKAQREKDEKQTLDLVNTSLSAVRTAISMGNQAYPQQTLSKDNMLIRKNLLGFSALNKPSTTSDVTSVTSTGISTVAANNSLLQHMLGTSSSEHLTTTSHLIPSVSTHELNLQKMSLSSASSVTSNPTLGALTSHSHSSQVTTTSSTTSSSRPRLTTIAALLNIDSGSKTQAELQLRQLAMSGITTEGLPVTSSLAQTLSIISPITTFSTAVSKNVSLSSSQVTMVPTLTSRTNPSLHTTAITTESSQTETPASES